MQLWARLKAEREVFEQAGRVAFDGEVVVRVPLLDQVAGDIPLRQ